MSSQELLSNTALRTKRLTRDLEDAQFRIRDLEHHLKIAIQHIANEHRAPAHIIEPATRLLRSTT